MKIMELILPCLWLSYCISASETEAWTPRANPLPKPASIDWAHNSDSGGLPLYLVRKSDLILEFPKANKVLRKGIKRCLRRLFTEKWIPKALAGPPKKYKPFPTQETMMGSNNDDLARPMQVPLIHQLSGQQPYSSAEIIHKLVLRVNDIKAGLQHGVDESYSLKVSPAGIEINSTTVWGALHALSTLEQLVEWDPQEQRLFIERSVSIIDAPLYPYRGIMIDTARNFYSVPSLLRQLDSMALSKLNVFHWHMVDTQSWPVELSVYPEMILDAYSPTEIYTQKDIYLIVQYGYLRGIHVIPEIDMPAHSNSGWRQINSQIISCGDSFWNGYGDNNALRTAQQPTPGHLDVLHPDTLSIVGNIYRELSSKFKDSYFHVGLDEIMPNCYNYSSYITEWFKENTTRTYRDLVQNWVDAILPIFLQDSPDRRIIMWEDALLSKTAGVHTLPRESVILQSWMGGKENVRELLNRGYDVIVSASDFFYLDCGMGGFVTNDPSYNVQEDPSPGHSSFNYHGSGGSWCAPYKTWQRIYSYDFDYTTSDENFVYNKSQILGASVQLWSEQSDSGTIDMKLWPRSAAFAELLWSGNRDSKGHKRTSEFTQRIINFRERLVGRGISAEAIVPRDCVSRPHNCDLFMNQMIISD